MNIIDIRFWHYRHVGVDIFGSGSCSDVSWDLCLCIQIAICLQLKCSGKNNECLNMINNTYLVRIFYCLQLNQFNLLLSFICLLRTLCVGTILLRSFGRCCPITLSQWSSTVSTCLRLLLPTHTLTSRNSKTSQVKLDNPFYIMGNKHFPLQTLLCTYRESQGIHHFLPPIFGGRNTTR